MDRLWFGACVTVSFLGCDNLRFSVLEEVVCLTV